MKNEEILIEHDFFPEGIKIDEKTIFPMAVIATMSSGKSTVVNALLGKEMLPNSNEACTSRCFSILDDDQETKEIVCVTDTQGRTEVIQENLTKELEKINHDQSEDVLNVFIRSHVKGVLNTDKALLMIDTPGPNNSRDISHENHLMKTIEKIKGGLFLYVLNVTQLGIHDDKELLITIKKYLDKNPKIQILFALNKMDMIDEENEQIQEYILTAKEYLEGIGFENINLVPVSARAALLFKKVLAGETLTRKEYQEFISLYELYVPKDFNMKKYAVTSDLNRQFEEIIVQKKKYEIGNLNQAIENTGITVLEEYIQKAQILSSGTLENKVKVKMQQGVKTMTNFSIEYNPYLVECIFKKNGKVLNRRSRIGAKSKERLQVLLGESANWKGLLNEIAIACDDDEVEITFKGRRIDYDDLKYTAALYEGPVKFSLKFEEGKNDTDVISELDTIFDDIQKKDIPEFHQKNPDGKTIFDAYEEAKNGIFEVNVIATMSSGKSTLINSLLHTELLPSKNAACTATIASILDNDDMEEFEAECYGADNKTVVYPRKTVKSEMLSEYNEDKKVTYINIEGNVPGISSDKIRLCLRDTPGPNNSMDENHEQLTRAMIKRTNAVVLYVMNATQMRIKDDKGLLKDISSEMKRAGKQSRDRFIFVINKCDALDEQKGETVEKLLDETREYLKEFGIINPTLIPTSAKLALHIRKARKNEKLSRIERQSLMSVDDFVNNELLHYEKYAVLTPTVREYLENEVEKYHENEDDWDLEALIHSGVPAVEQTVCEYIDKYAYPIKIKDAVKDILGILDELNMKAKFEESIAKDADKLKLVRQQIAEAEEKHQNSMKLYEDYKSKINEYALDPKLANETKEKVEKELGKKTKPYDGKEKMDKAEAEEVVHSFKRNLEEYQKEFEQELNRKIDKEVYQKGENMLKEYKKSVQKILSGIKIEGFDFRKVNVFNQIKISNVDEMIKKNEADRYREETRWRDNPEREGFFGFFKFWKPKEIWYTVSVKDGIDVNVHNVIVDIAGQFNFGIKQNIDNLFQMANWQVDKYKKLCNENFDILQMEISKILQELKNNTAQSEKLEEKVENNKDLAVWFAKKEKEIKDFLAF